VSRSPMQRSSVRALCLLVVCLAALAACGIANDRTPRDIAPDERPDSAESTAPPEAQPGAGPNVYLLAPQAPGEPSRLRAVGREVSAAPTNLVNALFAGPTPEDQSNRLRTAIPPGTTLRTASRTSNGIVVVDVSPHILQATGDALIDAVAQVVFTATELDGVSGVRLLVDGEQREWPRGDGSQTADALTRFDYPERNPTTQPDYPALPSPSPVSSTTTTTTARAS
jgi:spore germination protein GerM